MYLLAASGAFRTILLLLIVWLVLRMWMRSQRPATPPPGTRWTPPDDRRPGEVRIEQAGTRKRGPDGPAVEDADFEEIK